MNSDGLRVRVLLASLFVTTVLVANWAVNRYGIVPIGFGLAAPAGVYAAGVAFGLRDALHEAAGRSWVLGSIAAGGLLSAMVNPKLALASAVAFTLSETVDLLVYEPLRDRQWSLAVIVSNLAGAVVDSALFLWLAFRSLDHLTGQVVGKTYMTAVVLPIVWAVRHRRRTSRPAVA